MSCPPPKKRRPGKQKKKTVRRIVLRSSTYLYYAIANGVSREYRHADRVQGYGPTNIIPDPRTVTLTNVFVNGALQPSCLYHICKGSIRFLSEDLPAKGVPLIVQSIKLYR